MNWGEEEYPSSFLAATLPRPGGRGANCWCLVSGSGENSDFPARNWTKPPVKLQPTLHPDPRSRSQQHLHRSDDDNTDDTSRQRRSHLDLHPPYAATPSDRTFRLKQATPCATPVGARSYKRTGDVPKEVTCQKRCQVDSRCVLCCLAVAPHLSVRHHPRPSHGTCIPGNRRRLHVSAVVPTWPGLMSRTSVAMCDATGCSPCPRHLGT